MKGRLNSVSDGFFRKLSSIFMCRLKNTVNTQMRAKLEEKIGFASFYYSPGSLGDYRNYYFIDQKERIQTF